MGPPSHSRACRRLRLGAVNFPAPGFPRHATLRTLSHAVGTFTSWRDVWRSLKEEQDAADNEVVEPSPVPEGKFATFVADPPWRYGNTSTRGAAGKVITGRRSATRANPTPRKTQRSGDGPLRPAVARFSLTGGWHPPRFPDVAPRCKVRPPWRRTARRQGSAQSADPWRCAPPTA